MNKENTSVAVIMLLAAALFTSPFCIQSAKATPKTWYVDDDGGADFTSIQQAINAASSGDTIFVHNGTYYERPVIPYYDEPVIAPAYLTITGENKYGTIIDGGGVWVGSVVTIYGAYVTLSGFSIRNAEKGISLRYTSFANISNNIISNNVVGDTFNWGGGIYVDSSHHNTIANNIICNATECGIWHMWSSYNIEYGNLISSNDQLELEHTSGVYVGDYCYDNFIFNNTISKSRVGIYAGQLAYNNTFSENTISDLVFYECGINIWGPDNTVSNNNISNMSYVGIQLNSLASDGMYGVPDACANNLVIGNTIRDCAFGINLILAASYNTITNNIVTDNQLGVLISDRSNNNTITGNYISNSYYGILLFSSNNSKVYHNSLVDNTAQTLISNSLGTIWDDGYPSGGNYWSDYIGADANDDAIGDTPYAIDMDNVDHYPFIYSRRTHPCDINGDGRVDVSDVAVVSCAFGSYPTHERWNPTCDINGDSKVDIIDIALTSRKFGWHKPT